MQVTKRNPHFLATVFASFFQCHNVLTPHTLGGHYPWHTSALICKTQPGPSVASAGDGNAPTRPGLRWRLTSDGEMQRATQTQSVFSAALLSAASTPTGRRGGARRRRGSLLFARERARRSGGANAKLKHLHWATAVRLVAFAEARSVCLRWFQTTGEKAKFQNWVSVGGEVGCSTIKKRSCSKVKGLTLRKTTKHS